MDLAIRNKEEQKHSYEHALAELKDTLARERSLTLATPRFVGATRVVPKLDIVDEMREDPDVERIAMKEAMLYEREQGRTPEDVSSQNLGFDVRSTGLHGHKHYIEVKGRAVVGPVQLTQNEWFKAKRFKDDYYLYVVLNAAIKPQLYIISNPALTLQPDQYIEVRYLISVQDITTQGNKA